MISRYRAIILLVLCVPTASLSAASVPSLAEGHAGDQTVELNQIRAVLTDSEHLEGRFHQEQRLPGVVEPLVSQGQFYFVRDRALLWQTQMPFASDVVFRSERQRGQSAAQRRMSKLLLDIFGANILDSSDFDHEVSGSNLDWRVLLTPQRKSISKHITEIELQGGGRLQTTTLVFAEGRQSHIEFTDVVAHLEMPEHFCQSISELCESP
jgi:hypothetical protein